MSSVTGIELGADYCALVRARWRGPTAVVSSAHIISAGEWPSETDALAGSLRRARWTHRLPRRAHVVAWSGSDLHTTPDAANLPALQPFVAAGFEIAGVLTPPQALARIVRLRHNVPEQAIAALALNTHGAAIAIVRGEQLLYSRVFPWAFGRPFSGARPELLDRYILISQLAPQLQHGINLVRPVHHAVVTSAIACGNLPDLRSLAMLLIEELDLEVDTLDSDTVLDQISIDTKGDGRLADSVAALQLASAAAFVDHTNLPSGLGDDRTAVAVGAPEAPSARRDKPSSASSLLRGAAAVAAVLTLSTAWSFAQWSASSPAIPIADPTEVSRVADQTPGLREASAKPPVLEHRNELKVEATMGRFDPPRAQSRDLSTGSRSPRAQSRGESKPVPLPQVEGILISGDRRLAIVGGLVVAQGDQVGPRAVVRIERSGVVLREPGGAEVFVPVRGKRGPGGGL